jgi:hypothetical protein
MKKLTAKQLKNLTEYIVSVEKEFATDSLKSMEGKGYNDLNFMYSQGSYTTLKHICELLDIKYSFSIK